MLASHIIRRSSRLSVSTSSAVSSPNPKRRKLSPSVATPVELTTVPSPRAVQAREREEVDLSLENKSSDCDARVRQRAKRKPVIEEPDPANYRRTNNEWKFGAHVSVAGGVENAIVNAADIGANAFALFLKSQRKWTSSDITEESISRFKVRLKAFGYDPYHIIPHGNYLINLGNPDTEKRQKSFECFLDDLRRCELLGLKLYNFHPGSTVGLASKEESISFIAECLNKAHKETESVITVIENMAGAGNVVGSTFAEIASIIRKIENKARIGVCLDTCHAFAAGYDLKTQEGYDATFAEFDSIVGLQYLRAMHLNDSKTPCGSNKDRHENIGLGHLTLSASAFVAQDERLKNIPLILETPRSSSSDTTGNSPAVWRAEIEMLNQLSNTKNDADGPVNMWKEMTRTIEGSVGRIAVVNGGGAQQTAKKSKTTAKKRSKKQEDGWQDNEACDR